MVATMEAGSKAMKETDTGTASAEEVGAEGV